MSPQDKCVLSFYRELEPIGASGKVMLVRHIETGQVCVRKRLSAYNAPLYRFLRDTRPAGVPAVYECLDDDDFAIVIEEYVSGITLRSYLTEHGPLSESDARGIISALCDTLNRLHSAEKPVICRDLKPENVILSSTLVPTIIDFDSAKFLSATRKDTVLLGTPGYAAPEQFGFAASDGRTDIYALGVIYNELLTGKLPGEQLAAGKAGILISQCISMNPDDRPKDVNEVKKALWAEAAVPAIARYPVKPAVRPASESTPVTRKQTHPKLLPGFRNGDPFHMIVAALGYAIGVVMMISYFNGAGKADTIAMNITLGIIWMILFLWTVFYAFDYLGLRTRTPLVKRIPGKAGKTFGYIVAWVLLTGGLFAVLIVITYGISEALKAILGFPIM